MARGFKKGEAPWELQDAPPQAPPPPPIDLNASVPQETQQPAQVAQPQSFKAGSAPWETDTQVPEAPPPPTDNYSTAESGLEGLGQGISFGYLPQLQSLAEVGLNKVLPESMGGQDPTLTYQSAKDKWLKRNQAIATEDPLAYAGGNVAGSLLLPGMGAAKGASVVGRTLKAAGTGGVMGAIYNPGDVEGKSIDPKNITAEDLQIAERLDNAQTGALLGGAAQGLGSLLGKTKDVLSKGRQELALKLAGARKAHFKDIEKFKTGPKIEEFLDRHGLTSVGKTYDDVLAKSKEVVESAGKQIGAIHDEVADTLELAAKDHPTVRAFFQKNQLTARDMAADVLKTARKELRGTAGGKQALGQLRSEMKNLASLDGRKTTTRTIQQPTTYKGSLGETINTTKPVTIKTTKIPETPFKSLLKYRESLDDVAKWNKTFNESTGGQKALKIARRVIKDKMDKRIDEIDRVAKAAGIKGLPNLSKLKGLNKEYGTAKTVQNMSADKAAAEAAKANVGLLETIAGTGYAASEIAQGKDPLKAIGTGLVGGMALRQGRKLAPGAGYQTIKFVDKYITRPGGAVGNAIAKIPTQAITSPWLEMNKKRGEK